MGSRCPLSTHHGKGKASSVTLLFVHDCLERMPKGVVRYSETNFDRTIFLCTLGVAEWILSVCCVVDQMGEIEKNLLLRSVRNEKNI